MDERIIVNRWRYDCLESEWEYFLGDFNGDVNAAEDHVRNNLEIWAAQIVVELGVVPPKSWIDEQTSFLYELIGGHQDLINVLEQLKFRS